MALWRRQPDGVVEGVAWNPGKVAVYAPVLLVPSRHVERRVACLHRVVLEDGLVRRWKDWLPVLVHTSLLVKACIKACQASPSGVHRLQLRLYFGGTTQQPSAGRLDGDISV